MFNSLPKLFFITTVFFRTLVTISANSWLRIWIGLEINLLSFIPLMITPNNSPSSEASLKYFITQAFASSLLLFFIIFSILKSNLTIEILYLKNLNFLIYMSLIIKLGAAPFHFWFPNVLEGLNWINNFIIITWQKIAPIIIISYSIINYIIIIIIIFSIVAGSLGGLNQTSIRKIIAFSSINHIGWMLSALFFNERLWYLYFLTYTIINRRLIFLFHHIKIFYLNQIFSLFINSYLIKFIFIINFLSLGGLPPFIGFFPKWIIIQSLSIIHQNSLIFIIITITLITLFFYLRISFSAFILNYENIKWNYHLNFNILSYFFLIIITIISLIGLLLITYLLFNLI